MVFLFSFLTKKSQQVAPTLLKHGLSARFAILQKLTTPDAVPESLLKYQGKSSPLVTKKNQASDGHVYNSNSSSIQSPAIKITDEITTKHNIRHDGLIYDNIDNTLLDSFCLLPLTQYFISKRLQDELLLELKEEQIKNNKQSKSWLDRLADDFWENTVGKLIVEDDQQQIQLEEEEKQKNKLHKLFERIVRPILFPNELWGDRHRWQFNQRFVMWLRIEFLFTKNEKVLREALNRYPVLRKSTNSNILIKNKINKEYRTIPSVKQMKKEIPTIHTLMNAFHLKSWNREKIKDINLQQRSMIELTKKLGGHVVKAHESLFVPILADDTKINHLSLENLLELTGAQVHDCGSFNLYCEQRKIYELWTQEYIENLANYLLERTKLNSDKGKDTLIMEIGAGDGTLSTHLEHAFKRILENQQEAKKILQRVKGEKKRKSTKKDEQKKPTSYLPTIVAIDDGSWNIQTKTSNVEKLNVKQALDKYVINPTSQSYVIVICSWMPKGLDWTRDLRKSGVNEYILIGESDDGCCGHNWYTWGNPDFAPDDEITKVNEGNYASRIPYKIDGFHRHDLENLSTLQFSRYDSETSRSSSTYPHLDTHPWRNKLDKIMRLPEAEEVSEKYDTFPIKQNLTTLSTLRELTKRSVRPINIGTAVLPKPLFQEENLGNTSTTTSSSSSSCDQNQKNLYEKTLSSEFNSMVIEHHLKWSPLCETLPGPHPEFQPKYNQLGRYDFYHVDRMVDYAKSHNMTIKGHVLIWHVTSPTCLNQISDPNILRREMKRHINTVMGRYKDSIHMWDVVNESLAPDGSFANNVFYRVLGESYIEDAFRMAHEADPTAFLIYNDNKVEGIESKKSEAFFQLLKKLVENGVPIHGAGMQAHFNAAGVKLNRIPSPMSIRNQIRRIGELGLKVNISEMDVRISKLPPPSSIKAISAIENKEMEKIGLLKDITSTDTYRSFVQYKIYRDILTAALAEPAFDGIWFWGFTDKHTWVKHFYYDDSPLLFDEEYRKKASYYGVKEALETVATGKVMLDMDYESQRTWGHEWMQPEPESQSESKLNRTEVKDSKGSDKPDWQQS